MAIFKNVSTVILTIAAAIILVLATSFPVMSQGNEAECPHDPAHDITYKEIREKAINDCTLRRLKDVDIALIDSLIQVEKNHEIPPSVRGLLLAASCSESGYNPKARGDYRRIKGTNKRKPRAYGILQFWPWANKYIDRDDPIASANFWLSRIKRQVPFVAKRCKFKSDKRIWYAAHVTAVRAPKKSGRCYEKSRHHALLNKWHRSIRKDRQKCWSALLDGDGC